MDLPSAISTRLLSAALDLKSLADFQGCAQLIASDVEAMGCVIWELAPTFRRAQPPHRKLAPLTSWFREDAIPWKRSLFLQDTVSGQGILSDEQRTSALDSSFGDPLEWDPQSPCPEYVVVTPLRFLDKIGTSKELGGLSTYFVKLPGRTVLRKLSEYAEAFPYVFAAMADRPSLEAVRLVSRELERFSHLRAHTLREDIEKVLKRIAGIMSKSLRCEEVTIFLSLEPVTFSTTDWLSASTLPFRRFPHIGSGLTGHVLARNQGLWIPNLRYFFEHRSAIEKRYGPIQVDPQHLVIDTTQERALTVKQRRREVVCSFMAEPISSGDSIYGAIRCSMATEPAHFTQRELAPLALVANTLGRFWGTWLAESELHLQSKMLAGALEQVIDLSSVAQTSLATQVRVPLPHLKRILRQNNEIRIFLSMALRHLETIIPRATINSIRIVDDTDPTSRYLEFAVTSGAAWDEGLLDVVRSRRNYHFPLDEETPSLGRLVVRRRRTIPIPDVYNPGELECRPSFESMTSMVCIPLLVGESVLGVLDLRSETGPFEPREILSGEIFALLIGLFLGMSGVSHSQNEQVETQQRMIADLVHQLGSPLKTAGLAVHELEDDLRVLLDRVSAPNAIRRVDHSFRVATRLIEKADQVARSATLFRELNEPGGRITLSLEPITGGQLRTILEQAVDDSRLLAEDDLEIDHKLTSGGLRLTDEIEFDTELLNQCLSQLFDNARKYSYPRTEITLQVSNYGGNAISISVTSTGVPFEPWDAEQAIQRGWRGDFAHLTTAEGQGLGLWIVDNVARANRARFSIRARGDVTIAELIIPLRRSS
jgi:signal transduction histidine kinase